MRTLKRRRKEGKTNYLKRIKLLKSGLPRVVFRKTNKYIISQIITSKNAQDNIQIGITSKELLKYGWPKKSEGSLKSLPASYLTGFLMGRIVKKQEITKPILDLGMIIKVKENKFFAFIKGMKDSGLEIECDKGLLPSDDRAKGKHLKQDFSKTFEEIKSNIDKKWK